MLNTVSQEEREGEICGRTQAHAVQKNSENTICQRGGLITGPVSPIYPLSLSLLSLSLPPSHASLSEAESPHVGFSKFSGQGKVRK